MNEGIKGQRGWGSAIVATVFVATTACVSVTSSRDAPPIQAAGPSAPPTSDIITALRQTCEPRSATTPKPADEIQDCYRRGLIELMQTQGATMGMLTLYQLAETSPRFANLCHVAAHQASEFMYLHMGNISEAMALCQEGCAYACQHAVLRTYLRDLPQGTMLDLGRLCPQNPLHLYSLSHWQCTHGIGHGLAHYFPDIHKALAACKHFPLPWEQKRCTQGVFMESTIHAAQTQDPSPPVATHLRLCEDIGPDQRFDCYNYRISLVDRATGGSVPAMFVACETIPPADRPGCYFGIGRVLTGLYIEREDELIGVCRSKESTYAAECMLGFASILVNFTGLDRGFRFCAKLHEDARVRCAERMGRIVRLQWTDPEQVSAECRKAGESPYVRACLEARITPEELRTNVP